VPDVIQSSAKKDRSVWDILETQQSRFLLGKANKC
jgi:hypothetical protein